MQTLLLEFEVIREYIVDQVVLVDSLNQPFSLCTMVHGSPAVLVIRRSGLHESPQWVAPYWHGLLARKDYNAFFFINFYTTSEELTCCEQRWDGKGA